MLVVTPSMGAARPLAAAAQHADGRLDQWNDSGPGGQRLRQGEQPSRVFCLGHHDREQGARMGGGHGHVLRVPPGTHGVYPYDCLVSLSEPALHVLARFRFGLRCDRVFEVKNDRIRS
jgi:hypothetical protein